MKLIKILNYFDYLLKFYLFFLVAVVSFLNELYLIVFPRIIRKSVSEKIGHLY